MKKISEMQAAEFAKCISRIAGPAESLLSDSAVREALDEYKKALPDEITWEAGLSLFASMLFPVLVGDAHRAETYEIIAALNDVGVAAIEEKSGLALMGDVFRAFVIDGEVQAIFRAGCEARSNAHPDDAVSARGASDVGVSDGSTTN